MLLVVAWDGATFDLIDPLLAAGRMPALARLVGRGATRELRSTIPAATFPAWTSFMTAASPARHGVTDFTVRDGYGVRFVNSSYRRLPTIWAAMSRAGLRVGVYGFPATYPPEPLNGFQICGFDTPLGVGDAAKRTHPPGLAGEMVRRYGSLGVGGPSQSRIEPGWHERALGTMLETIELRTRIACDRLREDSLDCFAVHFQEPDTVCHQFWHFCDPGSPRHVPAPVPEVAHAVTKIYEALDASLGRLLEAAGSQADVVVLSDHGSGGTSDRVLFWNRWLADHGWLRFRARSAVPRLGRAARSAALRWTPAALQPRVFASLGGLVRRVESGARLGGIDWRHTRAFSEEVNYHPAIWLNMRGREPEGIVDPAESDEVLARLSDDLRTFCDPFDGGPVVQEVLRREQLFDGPWAGRAPDLVLVLRDPDGYSYACAGSRGGEESDPIRKLRPAERTGARGASMPGSHRPLGICVMYGAEVIPGRYACAELSGAGATLLAMLGLGRPADADGRAWNELLRRGTRLEPYAPAVESTGSPHDVPYSDAEEGEVAERLRALGYMD